MIIELLEDLSLIQYAFIQNRLIESTIKNLRELLKNQIDQENYNKESSWIALRSIALRNIFFVEQTYVFLFQIIKHHHSFNSLFKQLSSSSLWHLKTHLIKIKLSLISHNKHVHKLSLLSSTHNMLLHSLLSTNQTLKSLYMMIWKYERNVSMLLIEKQIVTSRWNNETRAKFNSWKQNYKLSLLSQSM